MKFLYFNPRKIVPLLLLVFGLNVNAQSPTSNDQASNYDEGEFTYGAGMGMGFVPWQLQGGSDTSGFSLGSSTAVGLGDVNTNGKAFFLYGYDDQGVSAARYFRGTGSVADPGDARSHLLPGQVFSVKIATGNASGYKGINITSDNGSERLATFGMALGNYRFGNEDAGTFVIVNETLNPTQGTVYTVEAYQLGEDTCEIVLTSSTGGSVSTGVQPGKIGGYSLYAGSTNGDSPVNRLYFNNLLVERRCPDSTTWTGSGWSNGEPDLTKRAIIASGVLTVSEDLEMCTLTVSGTAQVIIEEGINITVANTVSIAETALMTVNNNANLLQIDNVQNTGNIKLYRNSSPIRRLDYTLWSSPVTGQNLFGFSPGTLPNRFYTYNSATNYYSVVPDLSEESTTEFQKGHGYLIRADNAHPTDPTIWTGEFNGVPNSGTVSVPRYTSNDTAFRYTLVGNPYPSAISIDRFLDRNSLVINPQLWFWRKTNNHEAASYSTVTPGGGYVGTPGLENSEDYDPNGIIRTGQGFFVEASSSTPANVIFNNSLREADNSNTFFRSAMNVETADMNRFWLNVSKDGAAVNQMLVNYRNGATTGFDNGIDGTAMDGDGAAAIYSVAAGKNLSIQGRGLPFFEEDVVTLGFRANNAGNFEIELDRFDGLFITQDIFIRDNYLGIEHNLKSGSYDFASEAGTFSDRFEIIYAETLGTKVPELSPGSIFVYKQGTGIVVTSGNIEMESISVYDLRGRLLSNIENVNPTEAVINGLPMQGQMLIVQVTAKGGGKISKKIIF